MVLFAGLVVLSSPSPSEAQAQRPDGEIVQEPLCFIVRNEAPYKVLGSFVTDYYTVESGSRRRHKSNFRLDEAGAVHETEGYPLDMAEFCSYGPFYPERKLEFVIRTLIPIFTCITRIDQGDIVIKGYRKPEGGTNTWAECFEEVLEEVLEEALEETPEEAIEEVIEN